MKILVLDDDVILARTIARMLKSVGHEVIVTHSMLEARNALEAHHFDCALLDTEIIGGTETMVLAIELVSECRTFGIKYIIGMSGNEHYKPNWHAIHASFLSKPFSLGALVAVLPPV